MRGAFLAVASLALAGAAVVACEQIIGADFGPKIVAVCDPAVPPGPPPPAPTPGDISFVAATYSIDFGDQANPDGGLPNYDSIGFDLDGRCTSLFDPLPCRPPSWAGPPMTDGVNGINNGVGALLYSESNAFGEQVLSSALINSETQSGQFAPFLIFRVSNYNGNYEDTDVTVELLLAVPLGKPPAWDGTDALSIDPVSATGSPAPDGGASITGLFVDLHAYVTNFTLVAHFGASAVRLVNVVFPTSDIVLAAALSTSGTLGNWTMTGTLAGHGESDVLLHTIPALTDSFVGEPICDDAVIYPKVKTWVCGSADSIVSGSPGPTATCDALSFGAKFETRLVQIAGLATIPDAGSLCPMATDPSSDTCLTAP